MILASPPTLAWPPTSARLRYNDLQPDSPDLLERVEDDQTVVRLYRESRLDIGSWATGARIVTLRLRLKTVDIIIEGGRAGPSRRAIFYLDDRHCKGRSVGLQSLKF